MDPGGVYFYDCETLVSWSTRLGQHLTLVAAVQWAAKRAEQVHLPGWSLGTEHSPYQSMAAPTSPGSEDAERCTRCTVTNEDHILKETSAADYCWHISWQLA